MTHNKGPVIYDPEAMPYEPLCDGDDREHHVDGVEHPHSQNRGVCFSAETHPCEREDEAEDL